MNAFLKKCQNAVRWRVRAAVNHYHDPDKQFNEVLSHLVGRVDAPVILDVGAHRGESISRFRGLFSNAHVHAFEPDQDNFEMLNKTWGAKPDVFLNNAGVSAEKGSLRFHRNLKSNTSGFHAVNQNSEWAKMRSEKQNVSPEEYTAKSYDVPVVDLDSYIKDKKIERVHLLKIDTQGHEDEVLRGAVKALKAGLVDVIETELIVGDAYHKSLTFSDIEALLHPYGYRFYGIDTADDLFHTPWMSVNLIYVHERVLA